MLPSTLNTNEVKDSSGVEVEFTRIENNARSVVYAKVGESPSLPHRLTVSHTESGSGFKKRRRSMNRVDKTIISTVDSVTPVTISFYTVLDAPIGALAANSEMANVIAEVMSFLASKGVTTTILYDCTGYGAEAALNGSL